MSFCASCFSTIHQSPAYSTHISRPVGYLLRSQLLTCEKHHEPMKMYCTSCNQMACTVCAYLLHRDHAFEPLERSKLKASLNYFETKLHEGFGALQTSDDLIKQKMQQNAKIHQDMKQKIEQECGKLLASLEKQEEAVVSEVIKMKNKRKEMMKNYVSSLKQIQQQLNVQASAQQKTMNKEDFLRASVQLFGGNIQPFCTSTIEAKIPINDFKKHIQNIGHVTAASKLCQYNLFSRCSI